MRAELFGFLLCLPCGAAKALLDRKTKTPTCCRALSGPAAPRPVAPGQGSGRGAPRAHPSPPPLPELGDAPGTGGEGGGLSSAPTPRPPFVVQRRAERAPTSLPPFLRGATRERASPPPRSRPAPPPWELRSRGERGAGPGPADRAPARPGGSGHGGGQNGERILLLLLLRGPRSRAGLFGPRRGRGRFAGSRAAGRCGAGAARRGSAVGEPRNAAVLLRSECVVMRAGLRGAAFSGGRSPLSVLGTPGAAPPGARGGPCDALGAARGEPGPRARDGAGAGCEGRPHLGEGLCLLRPRGKGSGRCAGAGRGRGDAAWNPRGASCSRLLPCSASPGNARALLEPPAPGGCWSFNGPT